MQSVSAGKITPLAEEFPRQAGREKAGAGLLHSGLCGPTLHSRARTVPPAIPPGKPFWPSLERCSPEQKKLINLQIALFHRCFAQPWIHGGDCGRVGAVSAGHAQGEQLSHQHHQHRQSSGLWGLLAFGAAPLYQKDSGSKEDQRTESFQSTPRDTRGTPGSSSRFPSLLLLLHTPHTTSTGVCLWHKDISPQLGAPATMGQFEVLSPLAESFPQDFPDFSDFPISPVAVSVPIFSSVPLWLRMS